jgi:GT2 family glycosyltransferase
MNHIAVLLTCFNRRATTLRCLHQLSVLTQNVDVYIVDDGSTDGTAAIILSQFPQVNLIQGNGSLFWNRGMHLAWMHAQQKEYDFFLWLNDDVVLYENCFEELLTCANSSNNISIISGIIESHDAKEILYGGTDSSKKLLHSSGSMQAITNLNGNVVLIPKSVFAVLGNLDPAYHHDLGDVDYGLRAGENKLSVFTTRVAVGSCDKNEVCRVRLSNSNIKKRFIKLYSPLGSHPKINFYFRRVHYGLLNACAYYIHLHLINVLPDNAISLFFGKRYS